ncbi:O-fucosyltransferase family protein [Medicago truncatula]|uniref:O-fucosyltransferase family protein n=1 Tax=Medicago truncatula TaxID=3880 RepID=G7JVS4_MEDTR|nr:O-fucosyltransferase family protein [Medicago truncatula]
MLPSRRLELMNQNLNSSFDKFLISEPKCYSFQGHRAYAGHKKYITPNKRQMHPYFLNPSLPEAEFNSIVKELHQNSLGQPELRTSKVGRDVTKYPVPECMCNDSHNDS